MQTPRAVGAFLQHVTAWAIHQPSIIGVALVGSHARGAARPDSDIDLVLLCLQPGDFLHQPAWIRLFGTVEKYQLESWGQLTSLRVHYQGGFEVEFGITTTAWARLPVDTGTRGVVAHGMRILLDRQRLLARLRQAVLPSPTACHRDGR